MPHRVGFRKERICTLENVKAAWRKYNRNRPVAYRKEYDESTARRILRKLERAAEGDASVFGVPRVKYYAEPGGKVRKLEIPPFQSRILQLAILNVVTPDIDSRLHGRTFSSRENYGGHKCIAKQMRFVRTRPKESKYFLYFDIRKFYEHIRHGDAIGALERVFKDRKLMTMLRGLVCNDILKGLPIGYAGSHIFANLVLCPLYHLLRPMRGVHGMFVYMDNVIVYGTTKKWLHREVRPAAVSWLAERGMSMKPDWQVAPLTGRFVHSCGARFMRGRAPRLYHGLNHRSRKNIDRANRWLRPHDCAGVLSRKGWYQIIGAERVIYDNANVARYKALVRKAGMEAQAKAVALRDGFVV